MINCLKTYLVREIMYLRDDGVGFCSEGRGMTGRRMMSDDGGMTTLTESPPRVCGITSDPVRLKPRPGDSCRAGRENWSVTRPPPIGE